jgi:hypothetical protein
MEGRDSVSRAGAVEAPEQSRAEDRQSRIDRGNHDEAAKAASLGMQHSFDSVAQPTGRP